MWEEEGWKSEGDTLWWNEDVKEAVSRKKEAHKAICRNSTEGNKRMYEKLSEESSFKSNERGG